MATALALTTPTSHDLADLATHATLLRSGGENYAGFTSTRRLLFDTAAPPHHALACAVAGSLGSLRRLWLPWYQRIVRRLPESRVLQAPWHVFGSHEAARPDANNLAFRRHLRAHMSLATTSPPPNENEVVVAPGPTRDPTLTWLPRATPEEMLALARDAVQLIFLPQPAWQFAEEAPDAQCPYTLLPFQAGAPWIASLWLRTSGPPCVVPLAAQPRSVQYRFGPTMSKRAAAAAKKTAIPADEEPDLEGELDENASVSDYEDADADYLNGNGDEEDEDDDDDGEEEAEILDEDDDDFMEVSEADTSEVQLFDEREVVWAAPVLQNGEMPPDAMQRHAEHPEQALFILADGIVTRALYATVATTNTDGEHPAVRSVLDRVGQRANVAGFNRVDPHPEAERLYTALLGFCRAWLYTPERMESLSAIPHTPQATVLKIGPVNQPARLLVHYTRLPIAPLRQYPWHALYAEAVAKDVPALEAPLLFSQWTALLNEKQPLLLALLARMTRIGKVEPEYLYF